MAETLKFTKVAAGHYATEDGRYAAVRDGYTGRGDQDFGDFGNEWGAVFSARGELREDHNAGENLDWLDTKREAIAACEEHAAQAAKLAGAS